MKIKSPYRIDPHQKVRLHAISSDDTGPFHNGDEANAELERHRETLSDLQELLTAEAKRSLLVVLQGMDTAGKDGTIRHIFTGVNPQACNVASFKVPTPIEKEHDFLWRVHVATPRKGTIGIFNRSHYEDVLVTRVHGEISDKVAHARMEQILAFEEMLAENDVVVLKFFLHISQEEQTKRLESRLADANKHWKVSEADFAERHYWTQYQKAYEDVLSRTSRKFAPWFVIPSDHKWYRNVAISKILIDVLAGLKMKYPQPTFDPAKIVL